ncbi:MAG: DEAD/DEAH box helicase family protein [Chloroflexi bacterium]|nr:DEAD/DEAH box helicase family protein [Chloroflexota bacterium]
MDFYFDNDQALALGSPARKFEHNLKAIRLAKEIVALGRAASPDEQSILSRYVGWGDSALLRLLNGSKELSQLLSEDELRSLRGSSLNAHYTALPVIGAMWDALTFMGFGSQAARVIDPSAGVGHFKSLMPSSITADWAEVELDSLTANILKLLHPESKVFADGYERMDFPHNWFDLAISNVPFGDYGVVKRELPSFLRKSIHDFFFANTVSLLRPGGVLAFITSRFTLDKKDSSVRAWLARHLDLLAAVRLPNNAFKENAGTEVVTDVLFMRKRFEETKDVPLWVETEFLSQNYRQTSINRYFMRNPQMILGVQGMDGTLYKSDGYTVHADDRILGEAMKEMLRSVLPENILRVSNEVVHQEHPTREIEITLSAPNPADLERINGLKSIYLAAKKLLNAETNGASLVDTSALRMELNNCYDEFTTIYEPINKPVNIRLLSGSYEAPFLKALEEYNATSATAKKADLFSAPLVRSTSQVESPSVDDALLVCLESKGKVDMSFIASLSGKTSEIVTHQLAGRIFRLPSGNDWVTADAYLSGNVREKLREAKAAAVFDPSFQENVAALESAIPLDLKPGQIRAPMGAGWIPTELVEKFTLHLLQEGEYKIAYIPHLAHWEIESAYLWRVPDSIARSRWGTVRVHALDLIEAGLNARTVTVYDEVEGVRSVNQIETVAAQAKLSEIKAEFERWLFDDPDRAVLLCSIYNERFNAFRVRDYDGSHLSAPGLHRKINLRPHQKNAVWRILQSRSTLLHHEVGMGKTLAALVAAMESKRLGLTRKAMIVVPNHITSQWNMSALAAYPGANILAPTPADLSKSKRGEFLSRVAANDWDMIIVPFSSFKLLPVSAETQSDFYQREIDTLFDYLSELKADKSPTRAVKEIEKSIKRFQVKLDNLADMRKDDEKTITWEELGVDMLIVDEFHAYKNLYFSTRMTRIAGLTNSDSQRAFDMFVKFSWTQRSGGKVIGLTGTPVTNTLAEFFTMQRYFQLETLQELGLSHFDAWANQFALAEAGLEMTPDGSGFRMNTRFRKFVNVPELMQIWFQVVDAKRVDDNSGIERPDLFEGKPVKVLSDGGQALLDYVSTLAERAEKVRARLVKPNEDNMLCITGDGRKAALDLSLVIPTQPNSIMPKIDALADVTADIYEATSTVRGTQIIFCDLATPKSKG